MATVNKKVNTTDISPDLIKQVADRIKALRKSRGYTNYEDFAQKHDIGRAQYWRYEKGENLTLASLSKILKAFNMTVKEFFGDGFML